MIHYKTSRWKGRYAEDGGAESELIQAFLTNLVVAIAEVANSEKVPIHFYVWSRAEIRRLVEGCCRAGTQLLASLRELLGCRESLEQLIFSSLQTEVDGRYGLGWTGRGLGVVSSLRWFGQNYHWSRKIGGKVVRLDEIFTQDIFDFKTQLHLGADGNWSNEKDSAATKHTFEIRSRFHDSLPAPYWHAVWRTLPTVERKKDPALYNAINRYNQAARHPLYLKEYLKARGHALRWVEEKIRFNSRTLDTNPAYSRSSRNREDDHNSCSHSFADLGSTICGRCDLGLLEYPHGCQHLAATYRYLSQAVPESDEGAWTYTSAHQALEGSLIKELDQGEAWREC